MKKNHPGDPESRTGNKAAVYCYMDIVAGEAERYALDHTTPLSPLLEEVEDYTLTKTPYPSMLTGRVEARFLRLMAELSGARRIVEVGTFTGYSALAMAEALPDEGEVLTIENNPDHAKIARKFFDRRRGGPRITLRVGEAIEVLRTLPDAGTDLVFIDADKRNYIAYYKESMRILREGGLILADNALWYGRVFDPRDDESRAMADFNELVNADDRAEALFLTIRDGIYVIRKRTRAK
jgi:caffeoyl-CoA O-methyltransferase